jgi:hypothetical protein
MLDIADFVGDSILYRKSLDQSVSQKYSVAYLEEALEKITETEAQPQ